MFSPQCEQKFPTQEMRMTEAYARCTRTRVAVTVLKYSAVGGAVGALAWKKRRLAGFAVGAVAAPTLGFLVLLAFANR